MLIGEGIDTAYVWKAIVWLSCNYTDNPLQKATPNHKTDMFVVPSCNCFAQSGEARC